MEQDEERILDYEASDEESSSDEDEGQQDNIISMPNSDGPCLLPVTPTPQTKIEFFSTLFILIISTTALLIILPLYSSRVNLKGNFSSIMYFNLPISTGLLVAAFFTMKFIFGKLRRVKLMDCPLKTAPILQSVNFSLILCLIMSLYLFVTSRNLVGCHLQDPLKGFVLVFALLMYFCYSRTFMGLHRIFSTTAIIVGLFIALDYSLCNQFVCRGFDIQTITEDSGPWTSLEKVLGIIMYITIFLFFSLAIIWLERHIAPDEDNMPSSTIRSSYVNTISRSVGDLEETTSSTSEDIPKKSALHVVSWIHMFCLMIDLVFLADSEIPMLRVEFETPCIFSLCVRNVSSDPSASFNGTIEGILCHFKNEGDCQYVLTYSLIFQLTYLVFVVSLVKVLMLSQCPVFTIAATTSSLPLVGIWWSLFYASPTGLMVWSPKLRADTVCSIIGLAIVLFGLGLLCKDHFYGEGRFKRRSLRRPQGSDINN